MTIEVTYIPSELKAAYAHTTYGKGGKVLEHGVQFDPFGAPESEE